MAQPHVLQGKKDDMRWYIWMEGFDAMMGDEWNEYGMTRGKRDISTLMRGWVAAFWDRHSMDKGRLPLVESGWTWFLHVAFWKFAFVHNARVDSGRIPLLSGSLHGLA